MTIFQKRLSSQKCACLSETTDRLGSFIKAPLYVLVISTLLLTACGGGGSGDLDKIKEEAQIEDQLLTLSTTLDTSSDLNLLKIERLLSDINQGQEDSQKRKTELSPNESKKLVKLEKAKTQFCNKQQIVMEKFNKLLPSLKTKEEIDKVESILELITEKEYCVIKNEIKISMNEHLISHQRSAIFEIKEEAPEEEEAVVAGCTSENACNYNEDANEDDGSCVSATTWYEDADGDEKGNADSAQTACTQPDGYVSDNTDADDSCTSNTFDTCGVCDGDDTCVDCDGTPNGSALEDNCGTCDTDTSNDCIADCAGVFEGESTEDNCGTCDEDPSNDCVEDCAGEWGGTAAIDQCDVCNGTDDCLDCAGTPDGTAALDNCGTCDEDPSNDCVEDCAGEWGGTAQLSISEAEVGSFDSSSFIDTCQYADNPSIVIVTEPDHLNDDSSTDTTTCRPNHCTLKAAVTKVRTGGSIYFASTITEVNLNNTGRIEPNGNNKKILTIEGHSDTNPVTIKAANSVGISNHNIFNLYKDTLTLKYLKLMHGHETRGQNYSGSAIKLDFSTLNLEHVEITENQSMTGGGIYSNWASGHLGNNIITIKNSHIHLNTAEYYGGGIYLSKGDTTLKLINSRVIGNTAAYSGHNIMAFSDEPITIIKENSEVGPSSTYWESTQKFYLCPDSTLGSVYKKYNPRKDYYDGTNIVNNGSDYIILLESSADKCQPE